MTTDGYAPKIAHIEGRALEIAKRFATRGNVDNSVATLQTFDLVGLATIVALLAEQLQLLRSRHATLAVRFEQEHPRAAAPTRDERQQTVAKWCKDAFGVKHASNVHQRGLRLLEEAIEAYQTAGGDSALAHKLVDFVFARPPGDLHQELGGIGVTLLALAQAAGLSAEEEEVREVERVLSKPLSEFAARNDDKNAAGFNVTKEDA